MSSPSPSAVDHVNMSAAPLVKGDDATEVTQADTIRNTMSLSNVLTPAIPTISDVTTSAPALAPPSTPTKVPTALKEEERATPDAFTSDRPDLDDADDVDMEGAEGVAGKPEFDCANDKPGECRTGQTTLVLSRKVISDHFGRNKACTRDITKWPLFCRKHYQRATYNKDKWQKRKVGLIREQFNTIEKQFPNTTYEVHFKKSEETRLNQYSRQIAAGVSSAEAELAVAPAAGKHFEAPIDVLRELDQWVGTKKTKNDVLNIIDVIDQMLKVGETEQVPSIEFLPILGGEDDSPKKTPTKSRSTKSPKTPKTPGRVSTKGSVKKTSQRA